jgi:excinuclease UvrABC nuclease subunit
MAVTQTQVPTITFTGASGKNYTFSIYALGTNFKALGGVYVFTKATPKLGGGNSHDVLYVGQTGDLSSRFTDHHKEDCVNKRGCNCICVTVVGSERDRLLIEADLVKAYNPPCNG